ncbi:MAG TPA: putative toxin-antitoxin system toxin component, PIN family [Gaiellaceae bacterium]
MRAVLDSNVLIAAILSPLGPPAQLVARWLSGEFELVVSDNLLAELERALAYPKLQKRIPEAEAAAYVSMFERAAVRWSDPPAPPARSTDSGDDYLIALAEGASAVLVSGDRHVLALAPAMPVRTAAEFLAELRD